ncbi:hypothetical protein [Roseburia sp. 499]|uniref:hypothetical protein n=1 Tax=Roseburia sp. 499 TaxID=1261634 RepID=UPI0009517A99|nr:hypothetical protein [Roseburia sp. 499]WVK68719.1 hypothetical protein BIV20_10025 [Roseburia sp. 499]
MKNKKKTNLDMGTLLLTGIMSMVLTFSVLMLAAMVTDTDIMLWDKAKAIPVFVIMSGLLWWYFLSSENKKEYKRLKKA